MTAFNFVDHDPRIGYTHNPELLAEFAVALQTRPGEWAEFPIQPITNAAARMLAYRIRRDDIGCPEALLGYAFDACCRDGVVYVRYHNPPYGKDQS